MRTRAPQTRWPSRRVILPAIGGAALAGIAAFWGLHGVGNAFLVVGLIAGFFAVWMLWGLAASNMNSQDMTYAFPHERRMHQGAADARKTHSAGIRVLGGLALVSAASIGLGFALRYLAANM